MILFEPQNNLVKKYVNTIYVINKSREQKSYIAFPTSYLAIGLFRNAVITCTGNEIQIKQSGRKTHVGIAVNLLIEPMKVCYETMPDEIAINFKPFGFTSFSRENVQGNKSFFFITSWQDKLKELFDKVFGTQEPREQLAIIESFLSDHFTRIENEEALLKATAILSDFTEDHSMNEVAEIAGMHYKVLYRSFMKYIGCSPAHFRKIARFRNSVDERLKSKGLPRFTEICYNNNYTDQPYFIKEYQRLTGESPKEFFRHISVLGDNNIIWRFY